MSEQKPGGDAGGGGGSGGDGAVGGVGGVYWQMRKPVSSVPESAKKMISLLLGTIDVLPIGGMMELQ